MKILHTADVHLHTEHPRRLEALQELVSLGREENIDLLLIAGDLFDDHQQAELLRGETRRLFSNLPYKVLAIPGNHDERAFSQDSFWGADFSALTQQPCSVQDFGAWRIVAVPYTNGSFASLAPTLKEKAVPGKTNVLLLHCSWSLPHYTGEDYGGEDLRYLPVTEETLTGLGYDYILAGHFHATYKQRRLPCGAVFVYPGSPVSVTAREQGPRAVNLVDQEGCRPLSLNTWYFQTADFQLTPGNTREVLRQVEQTLAEHSPHNCQLTINISGFIDEAETEFQARLEAMVAGRANTELKPLYLSVRHILDNPLYQRFSQYLEQESDPELRRRMEAMALEALSQLFAEGR